MFRLKNDDEMSEKQTSDVSLLQSELQDRKACMSEQSSVSFLQIDKINSAEMLMTEKVMKTYR